MYTKCACCGKTTAVRLSATEGYCYYCAGVLDDRDSEQ